VFFQGLKDQEGFEVVKPIEMDYFEKLILDAFNSSKKEENKDKKKGRASVKKVKEVAEVSEPVTQRDHLNLFEVFYHREFENEDQKTRYDTLCHDMLNLF